MGWVKTGSEKGEVLAAWRAEEFTVDTPNRKSWLGVPSGPWDWAGKVDKDQAGGGRGLSGFEQG